MSDPERIAREYFDAVMNQDFDRIGELFHADYTYTSSDGETQRGADAGLEVAQMYTAAFPDLKVDIEHLHVAGNTAILEFVATGTHQGELMGIAPTGRSIAVPVCNVLEIKDGKIRAEREYFDSAHMMAQLGVTPAAATA